jgi:hypothetical protein
MKRAQATPAGDAHILGGSKGTSPAGDNEGSIESSLAPAFNSGNDASTTPTHNPAGAAQIRAESEGSAGPEAAIPAALFWAKVQRGDGCWPWTGNRLPTGYGRVTRRNRSIYAHRVSWVLHHGPIPAGLWVLHRCDNPPCVRPDHLFLGTNDDNVADRDAKGRGLGHARLTPEDVLEIRRAVTQGLTRTELARKYGVARTTVSDAAAGTTWTRVEVPHAR